MKSLFTLFLILCLSTFSFSQETLYGVRGGLNISNLDFTPDATFSNMHRNGFHFGGFVDYAFSDKLSLMIEIQYSAEGAKADELRSDYIQLPLLLQYEIMDNLSIGVGPMVGVKSWKSEDAFSTFAFSAIGGLEYMITDDLFIDARYFYGITNILDADLDGIEAKNTNIQIGFGIKI